MAFPDRCARTCTHGSDDLIQFPFAGGIGHKLRLAGLYDPRFEHDACGVGFVVDIKGRRSNAIVRQALQVLINLLHRGACGCEANTGDGAGILIQMPDRFLRKEAAKHRHRAAAGGRIRRRARLPAARAEARRRIQEICEQIVAEEGLRVLGWRDVPTDASRIGPSRGRGRAGVQAPIISSGATASEPATGDRFL